MKIEINIPDTDITSKGLIRALRAGIRIDPKSKIDLEGKELIIKLLEDVCDAAFEAADPVAIEAKKELLEKQKKLQAEAKARRENLKNGTV